MTLPRLLLYDTVCALAARQAGRQTGRRPPRLLPPGCFRRQAGPGAECALACSLRHTSTCISFPPPPVPSCSPSSISGFHSQPRCWPLYCYPCTCAPLCIPSSQGHAPSLHTHLSSSPLPPLRLCTIGGRMRGFCKAPATGDDTPWMPSQYARWKEQPIGHVSDPRFTCRQQRADAHAGSNGLAAFHNISQEFQRRWEPEEQAAGNSALPAAGAGMHGRRAAGAWPEGEQRYCPRRACCLAWRCVRCSGAHLPAGRAVPLPAGLLVLVRALSNRAASCKPAFLCEISCCSHTQHPRYIPLYLPLHAPAAPRFDGD